MDIIERAARALSMHHLQGEQCWEEFADDVRAVLSALREPDEGMLAAGRLVNTSAEYTWQAMIDQALKG